MVVNLSTSQIEARLAALERMIADCRDIKSLPSLNATYQKLLDELVRRDLEEGR